MDIQKALEYAARLTWAESGNRNEIHIMIEAVRQTTGSRQ